MQVYVEYALFVFSSEFGICRGGVAEIYCQLVHIYL